MFKAKMTLGLITLVLILVAGLFIPAGCVEADKKNQAGGFSDFHDMAVPREMKPGWPAYSDVSMRTLTIRDVPNDDEKSIFRAAPAFHLTRIDWSYLWFTERELKAVKKLQDMGYTYCGSGAQHIPCWIGDRAPVDWQHNIILTDIEGNPSIMAFIRTWKDPQLIGDISNPVYYDGHLEFYKKLVDAGCDLLQRDAPDHHYLGVTTCGGGFTETGVAGFSRWLAENVPADKLRALGVTDPETFNYKQYLIAKGAPAGDAFNKYDDPLKPYWYQYWKDISLDFFSRLSADIKAYAGRDIPFCCNNGSFQKWEPLQQLFDMGISELMMVSANPDHLWERLLVTEDLGKFQIVGSAKLLGLEVHHQEKLALDTKVIATLYANGALGMVPWDTFEQTPDGGGRFFGEPEDYAPVFGFIRGAAAYLDGYDRAYDYSTKGILTKGVNPNDKPLYVEGTDNEVCAFVRINKKSAAAPVAVHLVDWGKPLVTPDSKGANDVWELATGEKIYNYVKGMENLKRSAPEAFDLVIGENAFDVPADSLKFSLLTPVYPYNRAAHEAAEKSKNYSKLVSRRPLDFTARNGKINVTVPPLSPWGILLIEAK